MCRDPARQRHSRPAGLLRVLPGTHLLRALRSCALLGSILAACAQPGDLLAEGSGPPIGRVASPRLEHAPTPEPAPLHCSAPAMAAPAGIRPSPLGSFEPSNVAAQPDWPFSPWVAPTISQRLRAIFVANDDGTRRTHITPAEVALWVAEANRNYQASGIRIEFDPSPGSGDWQELNSTLLNTMTGTGHPNWNQQKALGNQIAAQAPDRMTTFFRWGPNASPTGGGFSWTDYDFIVMPGFQDTWVCGHQNIGIFAHEAGHYLGLPHTFPGVFASISEATAFFLANGRDPEAFNADGRDETEPDPFVGTSAVQCDPTTTSITLDRVQFPLPRPNIMSYYFPSTDLVKSQTWTVRQGLLVRSSQGLAGIVSQAGRSVEGESRVPVVTQGGWSYQSMGAFHGKWSGNQHLLWLDGGRDASLTLTFPMVVPGEYDVYGSFTAAPDFGIHTHYINGQPTAPIDLYAGIVLVTGPVYLGRFNLGTVNEWRVVVTGSNVRAVPRHGYGLDYLLVAIPGTVAVGDRSGTDGVTLLMPARPNPFSQRTTIGYRVPDRGSVTLRIYDLAGRVVTTLAEGEHAPGDYSTTWSGTDDQGNLARNGVYFCRVTVGARSQTMRFTLVR